MKDEIDHEGSAEKWSDRYQGVTDDRLIKIIRLIGVDNISQRTGSGIRFEQFHFCDLVTGQQGYDEMTEFVDRCPHPCGEQ